MIKYLNEIQDSVARLFAANDDLSQSTHLKPPNTILGTCFYIGDNKFLTASHCLFECDANGSVNYNKRKNRIYIEFKNETKIEAKLKDHLLDVAIIEVTEVLIGKKALPCTRKKINKFQNIHWESYGFPDFRENRKNGTSSIGQTITKVEEDKEYDLDLTISLEYKKEQYEGFSGSPIVDEDGIIGIVVKELDSTLGGRSIQSIYELFKKNNINIFKRTIEKDKYNIFVVNWEIHIDSSEKFKTIIVEPFKNSNSNPLEILNPLLFPSSQKENGGIGRNNTNSNFVICPEKFMDSETFLQLVKYLFEFQYQEFTLDIDLLHFGIKSNSDDYMQISEINNLVTKLEMQYDANQQIDLFNEDFSLIKNWLAANINNAKNFNAGVLIGFEKENKRFRIYLHVNNSPNQHSGNPLGEANFIQVIKLQQKLDQYIGILPLTSQDFLSIESKIYRMTLFDELINYSKKHEINLDLISVPCSEKINGQDPWSWNQNFREKFIAYAKSESTKKRIIVLSNYSETINRTIFTPGLSGIVSVPDIPINHKEYLDYYKPLDPQRRQEYSAYLKLTNALKNKINSTNYADDFIWVISNTMEDRDCFDLYLRTKSIFHYLYHKEERSLYIYIELHLRKELNWNDPFVIMNKYKDLEKNVNIALNQE